MCATSAVGNYYGDRLPQVHPWIQPYINPNTGGSGTMPALTIIKESEVTRAEFDALRRDVEEMHRILRVAKKYDEDTGQKDCEMADKVKLLKQIAKLAGVDIYDVLAAE